MTRKLFICLAVICMSLCGCASTNTVDAEHQTDDTALESYNRSMFEVNRRVDRYVLRPVAKGYRAITNEYTRQRITNFFNNIEEPVSAANHILQGEFKETGTNIGRFVINSTLGLVGLYDVAKDLGLERQKTGFDETLAAWCVPDGPFVVLPIIGPSTPRAMAGFAVDGVSSPSYWFADGSNDDDAWKIYYAANAVKYINLMAENLKLLESLEEGSVDYYETVKSTYLQNRNKIRACSQKAVDVSPEYDFDMDDME